MKSSPHHASDLHKNKMKTESETFDKITVPKPISEVNHQIGVPTLNKNLASIEIGLPKIGVNGSSKMENSGNR